MNTKFPTAFAPLRLAILSTLLLITSTSFAATPLIFSLNSDWSDTQNPHGAWSYNYNDRPISVYQTFWWGQSGWGENWIGDGAILRGSSPAGMIDPWGSLTPPVHDWQPGDVMLHAISIPYGGDTTFLNVRWTSPSDGTINISGRAWDGQIFSDRDVAWFLTVGGEVFAHRSSVIGLYRTDAAAQFQSNLDGANTLSGIHVTQGEIVEFAVATQTYYGHFLGLDETISFTAVPEPDVTALLGLGLLGLGGRRLFKNPSY